MTAEQPRGTATATAAHLIRAVRAHPDERSVDALVAAALKDVHDGRGEASTLQALKDFTAVLVRLGAAMADGWDAAAEGAPARAHLAEVGALAEQAGR